MNMKELVNQIAADTGIPAGKVRKVVGATLENLSDVVSKEGKFSSPHLALHSRKKEKKTVIDKTTGKNKEVPARIVGILRVKKPVPKTSS